MFLNMLFDILISLEKPLKCICYKLHKSKCIYKIEYLTYPKLGGDIYGKLLVPA